ncbi:sodium:solute symporter family protein [Sporosarcina sp. CAU 1771]
MGFNSIRVRRLSGVTTVLGMAAYLIAVTQGISLLLSHLLEINYIVALLIVWFTYTSFTFLSGAKGVLLTDTIMYFIFSIATFLAVPFIMKKAGGWPDAIYKTAHELTDKPGILSWHGITGENAFLGLPHEAFIWAVILGVAWTCVVAIGPWQSSRYLMAKNEHVIMRTAAVATISILSIYILLHITMATVNLINPSINPSEMVFIWAAENVLPNWIGVMVISGIMAAGLSSASTFLQLIGNSLANDLKIGNKNTTSSLKTSRIAMLIASVVILIVTIYPPPAVMWIGFFAATVFAASWGIVAFASIHSKKITEKAAFMGMLFGLIGIVVGQLINTFLYSLPVYLEPVLIGVVLSALGVYLGSKNSKVTEIEKEYLKKILIAPANLYSMVEIKRTKKFAMAMIVGGFLVVTFTFVFYYYPVNIYG